MERKLTLKKHLSAITLGCLLLLSSACGNTATKTACKTPAPVSVFKSIKGFENHSFSLTGHNAVEKVRIPTMFLSLELYQSGCDKNMQQEFRFFLEGTLNKNTAADKCALEIAQILFNIGNQSPNLLQLQEWARMIGNTAADFKYNEPTPLQRTGFNATINITHQPKQTILTLVLSA